MITFASNRYAGLLDIGLWRSVYQQAASTGIPTITGNFHGLTVECLSVGCLLRKSSHIITDEETESYSVVGIGLCIV